MRKVVIAVVVLAVLAVVGDRVAEQVAEGEVASVVQERGNLSAEPDVEFKGFPFLTQLLGRQLDEVEMTLPVARRAEGPASLVVEDVEATFYDVSTSDSFDSAVAERMSGSAVVPYDSINAVGLVRASYLSRENGDPALALTSNDLGVDTRVIVGVEIRDGLVTFTNPRGGGALQIPRDLRGVVQPFVDQGYVLTGLPTAFVIESLEIRPEGLRLALSAQSVQLAS